MIRRAKLEELNKIMIVIEEAKIRMTNLGLTQWQSNYPNKEIIKEDILGGNLFIYLIDKEIVGTMSVFDYEETYDNIEGKWLNVEPYKVIHRIAVSNNSYNKGIAGEMLIFLLKEFKKDLKIDTHKDNIPMQRLLKRLGFEYCGTTLVGDPIDPLRDCFQKLYMEEE